MPDTPSVTLVKRFTYKDALEEWSNTYHFTGTTPGSDADWRTLMLAIWASEQTIISGVHLLVNGYGYAAGNDHSVAQIDFLASPPTSASGTYAKGSSDTNWAGDQAGWIRALVGTSSTGKKVYIRKYFHGGASQGADPDELPTALQTLYLAHANLMLGGSLPGTAKWCSPQGTIGTIPKASRYVTTRTLKRRGRRPT